MKGIEPWVLLKEPIHHQAIQAKIGTKLSVLIQKTVSLIEPPISNDLLDLFLEIKWKR